MEQFATQIKVTLSVSGEALNPESFTQAVGISPTAYWNIGDRIQTSTRSQNLAEKIPRRQESAWEYSSGFIQTLFFDKASEDFVKGIESRIDIISKLTQGENMLKRINIVLEIVDEQKPSLYFNKRFLELASKLSAEIDVDIYLINSNEIDI